MRTWGLSGWIMGRGLNFTDSLQFRVVGTQLQANVRIGTEKKALLIPRKFVDFNDHVQVKGEQNKRKIKTKIVSNEWVQVLEGIDENVTLIIGVE